jgi:hypothetical protein
MTLAMAVDFTKIRQPMAAEVLCLLPGHRHVLEPSAVSTTKCRKWLGAFAKDSTLQMALI